MEVDIDAVKEQLKIIQDRYEEMSKEYDRLYEEFNQTSQVEQPPEHRDMPTPDFDLFMMLWFHDFVSQVNRQLGVKLSYNYF